MVIDLAFFYNLSGILMCVCALLMFAIPKQEGEEGVNFNVARYYLAVMFMLSGLSMFVARFDRGMLRENFEILNPLMLLFFFLIAHGFLWSFFVLYASRYARRQLFNRILLPVIALFSIYTGVYFFVGDEPVFTGRQFLVRFPGEPMLMFRCVLFAAVVVSVFYCICLCHRAKREYQNLISGYFSETDFSRSIWLSNLLASAEALAVWILLTYFYTTPILEVFVGILMVAVFTFYVKEFYEYHRRYERFRPVLLLSMPDNMAVKVAGADNNTDMKTEDEYRRCAILLAEWKNRADKPYTKPGLTISDVAKDLHIPRYRISNYVNRDQGNFCSWVNDLRINEAARLLCDEPALSISDVAERTGFCDLPAFSRAFKKAWHVSPREYRNKTLYKA